MDDHLDIWNEREFGPAPEGAFTKTVWTGAINKRQRDEIISRAQVYAEMEREDRKENYRMVCAAWRTIISLREQFPD
jgi:hypothetical protein